MVPVAVLVACTYSGANVAGLNLLRVFLFVKTFKISLKLTLELCVVG